MTQKKKGRKKKKSNFKFLKGFLFTLLIIFLLIGAVCGGVVLAMIKSAPALDVNELLSLNQASTIYDDKGQYMDDVVTDEKRTVISFKDMPKNLKNAFVNIEDERFYKHNGIDVKRISGALYNDILGKIKKQNTSIQGASTITQQLLKNRLFLADSIANRLSVKRKVQEIYLAMKLEDYLTKDQILEAYMNTIFLGGKAYGVEAASNQYFNKSAKDLNLIECAFIAGIGQSPSRYYPLSDAAKKDPSIYLNRTKTVLYKMFENNAIDKKQYDDAISDLNSKKLVFTKTQNTSNRLTYEWFSLPSIEQVKQDLKNQYHYSEEQIRNLLMYGGLKIYTTMDRNLQDSAQKILNDDKNFGIKSQRDSNNILQPQASAVIMDYHTGQVKTIIGGRGDQPARSYNRAAFNGAREFLKPTGSSIKPLTVYAPAIDSKQATASTIIEDSPLPEEIGKKYGTNGNPYNPTNYDTSGFSGNVTIRDAIMRSINLVAIKLEDQIGLKTGAAYGENFGLTLDDIDKTRISPLALGELHHGANTLTMSAAFGTFGNNGMYTYARLYTKVVDRNGLTILETKTKTRKVLTPQSSYIMYDLLKGPTSDGIGATAPNARFSDMPVAGKTGTSSEKKNFWFCGLTPYYSGAVWIGNDTPKTRKDIFSSTSASIWSKIMQEAHKNLPVKDINEPSGIDKVSICKISGKIPIDACSNDPNNIVYTELFIDGTAPTELCDVHTGKTPIDPNVPKTDDTNKTGALNTPSSTNSASVPTTTQPQTQNNQSNTVNQQVDPSSKTKKDDSNNSTSKINKTETIRNSDH